MRALNKKVITGVVAGAIVLGGSGAAYAYWGTTGGGSSMASTAEGAAKLLVAQNSGSMTAMFPGDKPQPITGTITNQAQNSAYVRQVVVSAQVLYGGPTCDASDYVIANPIMAVNKDIPAGKFAEFSGATIQFNNKPDENQDDCKKATVVLNFAAS
jgi:hypothetical protein